MYTTILKVFVAWAANQSWSNNTKPQGQQRQEANIKDKQSIVAMKIHCANLRFGPTTLTNLCADVMSANTPQAFTAGLVYTGVETIKGHRSKLQFSALLKLR